MILDRLLDLEKTPHALRYSDREYDLDGFRRWLAGMGSPQQGLSFVHIAGTKGKGSTGVLVEGLLRGLGVPTAFFSSPHLKHFGERYRFDGVPWTFEQFEAALERLVAGLPLAQRQSLDSPHLYSTVFEFLTLLALVEFGERDRRLHAASPAAPRQIVCWETGLGGRLDCTNVVDPVVSVITALGLDHTALLGKEIEQITAEKAGIIKPGRPVIVSRQYPEFADRLWPVLTARAREVGAPLVRAWEQNPVLEARPLQDGQMVRMRLPDGGEEEAFLPLAGSFQTHNLEAAVAATWHVARSRDIPLSAGTFLRGLEKVCWPGRLEIHLCTVATGGSPVACSNATGEPPVATAERQALILDGAHCPLSARTVMKSLREWQESIPLPCRPPYEVLWGMQKDKDHAAFLAGLSETAPEGFLGTIHAYPVSGPRGADPHALAEVARSLGREARVHASPEEALSAALSTGRSVLAVGTLYTIAALHEAWDLCRSGKPAGPCQQPLPDPACEDYDRRETRSQEATTMFTIFGRPYRHCDGLNRRELLTAGALGLGGLTLADLLRAEAAVGIKSSVKAIINIHLDGGPPQMDMIDPKPEAPVEIRGEFRPIATRVAGLRVCELMPKVASIADKFAFLRSLVGSAGAHDAFQCQSGFADRDLQSLGGRPALGSVVAKLRGSPRDTAPPFVDLMQGRPLVRNSARPGFLGPTYNPFRPDISKMFARELEPGMKQELAAKGASHTTRLTLVDGLSVDRLRDRTELLTRLDSARRDLDASGTMTAMDRFTQQAATILTSGRFAAAMDLSQESPRVLARYTPAIAPDPARFYTSEDATAIRKLLLARRLIEAGVRCVSVSFSDFDTHANNFPRMRQLLPIIDHGLHTLVTDLEERGMLGDVSIVAWGEFGRTPRINKAGGRDHWPAVSPVLLAGGGMKVGQVIGATDRHAAAVVSRPVHFQDVFATLYRNLGIDPVATTLIDPNGRPQHLLEHGQAIRELI